MFYKKIISLIDCIVSKESSELTIEDLQKYGIKELDINIFIELKYITVKSPDTWHVRIFNIYEYAKNLRKEGSLDEALEVFTRLKKSI